MHLSTFDNFIDDQIAAGVDGDNVTRPLAAASPLAIHAIRPFSSQSPSPRDDDLSLKSLPPRPSETKVILGWFINAWLLTVSLPQDKVPRLVQASGYPLLARKAPTSERLIGPPESPLPVIGSLLSKAVSDLSLTVFPANMHSRHIDSDIGTCSYGYIS
jgi:hypothetical protein